MIMNTENSYDDLFKTRSKSLRFYISEHDSLGGSRIGGYAPAYFDNDAIIAENNLQEYVYYLSIGEDLFPFISGSEVSIFIPKDFESYNVNDRYPYLPIKCIFHSPSGRGKNEIICNKDIESRQLVGKGIDNDMEEIDDIDEPGNTLLEPVFGNKIGGTPGLLQKEISYAARLEEDNYVFVMQFDESSYLQDQITGNEPFCHGIIYFYGKFEEGLLIELVGGFWQN